MRHWWVFITLLHKCFEQSWHCKALFIPAIDKKGWAWAVGVELTQRICQNNGMANYLHWYLHQPAFASNRFSHFIGIVETHICRFNNCQRRHHIFSSLLFRSWKLGFRMYMNIPYICNGKNAPTYSFKINPKYKGSLQDFMNCNQES